MSYLKRIADSYSQVDVSQKELAYYARHILLPGIGLVGQSKLKAARVLVVGAGGLGCPVIQALAGAGVGLITVIDGDSVDISNLSRQWLHRYESKGENKAKSAVASVARLNPFIEVKAIPEMLSLCNAENLIAEHDIIVDATDVFEARYLIDDVCSKLDKPWVHAALYRERAQLSVFWSRHAASYRELFPVSSQAQNCAAAGMFGASASAVANLQALEVIKLITGNAVPKIGRLVSLNFEDLSLKEFQFGKATVPEPFLDPESLEGALDALALEQAQSINETIEWIDLRSEDTDLVSPQAKRLSPEEILESGLPKSQAHRIVLVCEEGIISAMLVAALSSRYGGRLYYLKGGVNSWPS